ncbi:GntR family transcriptional regulator [Pseudooceanicola sp. CBS1P-1]|uniref:GntR family transcriptional regulator n=1 Tax=Pseudooceanicola albus TaxID=2692189 RepID=A0A6L7G7U4_9RHOB|nr:MULTISPECIES: GntR family transcriptional regulator [Pseudooceanicola]MBT9386096.1 GntR family transcriptional regulator [Pseudooceanicola endophyticus]MXN19486.1 GntR family transcriptional regulator [Pseudooceanicola albus]
MARSAAAQEPEDHDKRATLFETAAELIRHNIALGLLYPGLVLQESALSERMDMSRATVKRALEMIEAEGRIRRFSGRGFLVCGSDSPRREDLRQIEMDLTSLDDSVGKPNWLRIYEDVERHVTRCPVFGRYRIIEALVAEEYGVSRTIVRDVLGRLQERGLIQKNRTSRWVVEPLTSQMIKNKYQLRAILEVAALRSAELRYDDLRALMDEINSLTPDAVLSARQWFALDRRFFETVILATPNEDLGNSASGNRLALEACQAALFALGLPPDTQSLLELGQVVELALSGSIPAAASMLSTHLEKARDRMIAQLKITAIIEPPQDFPAYLQLA